MIKKERQKIIKSIELYVTEWSLEANAVMESYTKCKDIFSCYAEGWKKQEFWFFSW